MANPPGMKFCGNCGARLAAAEATAVVPATAGPAAVTKRAAAAAPADPVARERERDRLLTLANVQRMRGQTADARATLDSVLSLLAGAPGRETSPVHELLGDLHAADENWEQAQAAYGAAHEADPNRPSAERKFAAATLRVADAKALAAAMASGNLDDLNSLNTGQRGKRNPGAALLLSLLTPGLGQFANGQLLKGGFCLAIWLLSLLALNLTDAGKDLFKQFLGFATGRFVKGAGEPVSPLFWMLVVLAAGIWVYSIVDAAVSASKLNEDVSGGDTSSFGGFSRKDWEP
jgi:hypothetical protein